jgi:glycosyltransferase involved in cell wall biosynthesis
VNDKFLKPMRIILCVTNDIVTDQRINRVALSLLNMPAEVVLIGLRRGPTLQLRDAPYRYYRFGMIFSGGFMFFANDLDTLPAVFLVSRIKRLPLIYDSHEYFTELPELIGRKRIKKIWEVIEAFILPRIRYAYTVSSLIAADYHSKYGISMQIVRNLPLRVEDVPVSDRLRKNNDKIIIYQGSLNMGRGLELAIKAMQYTENVCLVIAGSGYMENDLHKLVHRLNLHEKVRFLGRIPSDQLLDYTAQADLGISLEERLGLNYYYALPNKLFDYIQARIPVLVSDLPEMAGVVNHYHIGKVTAVADAFQLALAFNEMLFNTEERKIWTENLEKAASELCWENEEHKLLMVYKSALPVS